MADRVKILIQKRVSLKTQMTTITNLLDKNKLDHATLKLRIARLTSLFHAFEEMNDELVVLDPEGNHEEEATNVTERFYLVAGRIENILNSADSVSGDSAVSVGATRNESRDEAIPPKRRIKLPEAPLPTFGGRYENWLTFKNAFNNLIGSRTELSEIDKLQYLKSSLVGEAANKLKILSIDGLNYTRAWELLEKAYEVKRILISRHLSLIMNASVVEKESANSLSKLVDEIQQNMASLNALGVNISSEILVYIVESKLPKPILEKWEMTLSRDEYPNVEQIYEFVYKMAVCASKRERTRNAEAEKDKHEHSNKKRKLSAPNNQTFVADTSKRRCIACKQDTHPLFVCKTFKELPTVKRVELIRNERLCYNCLRSHKGKDCKFSNCKKCGKKHNSLLHVDEWMKQQTTKIIPENNEVKTD
ncbi:uncharacterized protein [Prorops nasuta]|uniref:uncharacterized protein n=1 Tax=Prorops nasuta TaxID=863751 RepID=UPI0034CECB24